MFDVVYNTVLSIVVWCCVQHSAVNMYMFDVVYNTMLSIDVCHCAKYWAVNTCLMLCTIPCCQYMFVIVYNTGL